MRSQFVATDDRLAIDEVQRAPDLLLEIKRVVDLDPLWREAIAASSLSTHIGSDTQLDITFIWRN